MLSLLFRDLITMIIGHNRLHFAPNAPHGSGGVGILVKIFLTLLILKYWTIQWKEFCGRNYSHATIMNIMYCYVLRIYLPLTRAAVTGSDILLYIASTSLYVLEFERK